MESLMKLSDYSHSLKHAYAKTYARHTAHHDVNKVSLKDIGIRQPVVHFDLGQSHHYVDEFGEDFSAPFFGPGKWTWDRKMSSGSVLSDSSRRSSQDEHRKHRSSDGSLHQYLDYLGERRRSSDASVVLTGDTDSFIIGERVWVGGTKPGQIAYIGETQFAPGDWAGVVLDEPIGKNDGSVANIRYFQCEAKRGVFSRLTRLTRYPLLEAPSIEPAVPAAESREAKRSTASLTSSTPPKKTSLTPAPSPKTSFSKPSSPDSAQHGAVSVGDRVIVMSAQGSKAGVLRYMGATDFAAGEWCGVELDDPLGKNDGSVAGTRYFECRPLFGLFAPAHKVSKSPATRRPSQAANCQIHRRGSRESLISATSSVTSVRSAAPRKVAARVPTTPTSTKNSLQEQLRDKEQHIEQLMRERELERAEVTRAASQADEAERRLVAEKRDWEAEREEADARLRQALQALQQLQLLLDEAKAREEDLQFRLEEASIEKESLSAESLERQSALEQAEERHQNKLFELDEQLIKTKLELTELQNQLQTVEAVKERLEADNVSLQAQVTRHQGAEANNVATLHQQLDTAQAELRSERDNLATLQQQLDTAQAELRSERDNLVTLQQQLDTAQAELRSERDNLATLQQQLDTAQAELRTERDNVVSLREQLNTAQSELCTVNDNVAILQGKLESVTRRAAETEKQLATAIQNADAAQDSLATLTQSNQLFATQLQTAKDSSKKLEETLKAELDNERKEREVEKNALREALSETQLKAKGTEEAFQKQLADSLWQVEETQRQLELAAGDAGTQLSQLNHSVSHLKAQLQETQEKGEQALKQLDESKALVTELSRKLLESDKMMEQLEQEKKHLEANATSFTQQIQQFNQVISDKESEMKAMAETRQELSASLQELKSEVADVTAKLDVSQKTVMDLQLQKTRLESELASSSEQLLTAQTELSLSEQKTAQTEAMRAAAQSTATHLQNQLDALQLDMTDLTGQFNGQVEKVNSLQQQKLKLETELAEFLSSSTDVNVQLQAKHSQLLDKEKELEQLRIQYLSAQQLCERSVQEIAQLRAKTQASEQSRNAQVDASNQTIHELRQKLEASEEKIKMLQNTKNEVDVQVVRYESTVSDIKAKLATSLEQLLAKDTELQLLNSQFAESKVVSERVQEQLQAKQTELQLLQQLSSTSKSNQDNLLKEKECLLSDLTQIRDQCETHQITITTLQEDKSRLEEELSSYKMSSSDATAQLHEKQLEISQLHQQNTSLESECQKLHTTLEHLRVESETAQTSLRVKLQEREQQAVQEWKQLEQQLADTNQRITITTQALSHAQTLLKQEQEIHEAKLRELADSRCVETRVKEENATLVKRLEEIEGEKAAIIKEAREKDHVLDTMQTHLDDSQRKISQLEQSLLQQQSLTESVSDDKLKLTQNLAEKVTQLELKEKEIVKLCQRAEDQTKADADLHRKLEEEKAASLRSQAESQRKLTLLERELQNTRADLLNYKAGYNKMEACQTDVTNQLRETEKQKEELSARLQQVEQHNADLQAATVNYTLERESLEKQLEYGTVLMSEKEKEMNKVAEECLTLRREKERVEEELLALRREKEKEKEELTRSQYQYRSQYQSQVNANIPPPGQEVEVSAADQVDFLNSVIVDMQLKNESLKARIQALELGDSPDDFADYDMLNLTSRSVAPRLFCDICDRFDVHDTEDCPTQAMDPTEDPPPARDAGKPKPKPPPPRPYCDACEVFGHDTADCDDAETY